MDYLNRLFPSADGDTQTHLWVAIFVAGALALLVLIRKGLPGEVI